MSISRITGSVCFIVSLMAGQLFSAVVGTTSIGATTSTTVSRAAQRVTMPERGEVKEISVCHASAAGNNVIVALYSDNAGSPGALLARSAIVSANVNSTPEWQTIPLQNPVAVQANTVIWLAWFFKTNPNTRWSSTGVTAYRYSSYVWPGSGETPELLMPSTFGAVTSIARNYSVYASYMQDGDGWVYNPNSGVGTSYNVQIQNNTPLFRVRDNNSYYNHIGIDPLRITINQAVPGDHAYTNLERGKIEVVGTGAQSSVIESNKISITSPAFSNVIEDEKITLTSPVSEITTIEPGNITVTKPGSDGTIQADVLNGDRAFIDDVNAGQVDANVVNTGAVNTDQVNAGTVNTTQANVGTVNSTTVNATAIRVNTTSNVVNGVTYGLAVNGRVAAQEVVVTTVGWADHVFGEDYQLKSLSEVEKFIAVNKHLEGIPTTQQVMENGVKIGEVQSKMLEKIEEMTLYMIQLKKENEMMKMRIAEIGKADR